MLTHSGHGWAQGTNGGVTPLGLGASLAGGLFIGAVFYCAGLVSPGVRASEALFALALRQWRLVPLGAHSPCSWGLHCCNSKPMSPLGPATAMTSVFVHGPRGAALCCTAWHANAGVTLLMQAAAW